MFIANNTKNNWLAEHNNLAITSTPSDKSQGPTLYVINVGNLSGTNSIWVRTEDSLWLQKHFSEQIGSGPDGLGKDTDSHRMVQRARALGVLCMYNWKVARRTICTHNLDTTWRWRNCDDKEGEKMPLSGLFVVRNYLFLVGGRFLAVLCIWEAAVPLK